MGSIYLGILQSLLTLARTVGRGVSTEDRVILLDPDHEDYWEVWNSVLTFAHYFDKESGKNYHLHHDGDLWAVCFNSMSDEERLNFGWDL